MLIQTDPFAMSGAGKSWSQLMFRKLAKLFLKFYVEIFGI